MHTLYGYSGSGNCYKIKLLLNQIGVTYEYKEVDIVKGESRTEEFLKVNPVGCIPALVVSGETEALVESNAILFYFAQDTPLLPSDPFKKSKMLQWMFFEQYDHEPNIATLRYWKKILKRTEDDPEWRDKIKEKTQRGTNTLRLMNDHLRDNAFFVDNTYSIADICLFAYTHKADEGGFDLSQFPYILQWIERVKQQPNHIPFEFEV